MIFSAFEHYQEADDPIANLRDTGSVQENARQELKAIQSAFKRRVQNEKHNISKRFDTEYWFCAVFEDRAQKEAFLAALDLLDAGDKYVDGRALAHRLDIKLPKSRMRYDWNNAYNKTQRF